jgi:hypothetical protein
MKTRKKSFARPPGIPRSRIHNANDNKSSSTEEKQFLQKERIEEVEEQFPVSNITYVLQ